MENPLLEIALRRRSVRSYKNTHIPDEEIRALLGVPNGYTVLNLIAIGEKGEIKQGYTERDLDKSRVHQEHY